MSSAQCFSFVFHRPFQTLASLCFYPHHCLLGRPIFASGIDDVKAERERDLFDLKLVTVINPTDQIVNTVILRCFARQSERDWRDAIGLRDSRTGNPEALTGLSLPISLFCQAAICPE